MQLTQIEGRLLVDYEENATLERGAQKFTVQDSLIINNLCESVMGSAGGNCNYDLDVSMICEVQGTVIRNVSLMIVKGVICDHHVKGISE